MRFLVILFTILILTSCGRRRNGNRSRRNIDRQEISDSRRNNSRKNRHAGKKMNGNEIFDKYNSAVFMVFTSDGINAFQGSGFFISSDGKAVSNYHVFQGTIKGAEIIKLSNGKQYHVESVISSNEAEDYILFKVRGHFNYIPVARYNSCVGDKVYAIGSPLGMENTFASGEISQIRNDDFYQISVPIDHGSSGGALINEYGEAIGITTSGIDDSGANLNFAKNIHVVKSR